MWFDKIEDNNLLVRKDNLEALREIPDGSVDLIYLDPPFFSGRDYNVLWGDKGEVRSFGDRWAGGSEKTGLEVYIAWMEERVREMHRVLKDSGSFYLHCDWHASHYLKVMCDRIFGYSRFENEIVWCYTGGTDRGRGFQRKHDVILFYAAGEKFTFNPIYEPFAEATIKRFNKEDEKGKYKINSLSDGRVTRTYMKEEGKRAPDYWHFPILVKSHAECVGYPTQKPLALLERIIKASSNEGDIVLDPFVGGGTTCIAAADLRRRYIGIDESVTAIRVAEDRIQEHYGMFEDRYPEVVNFPNDFDVLNEMDPYEFEGWIVEEFGGIPNKKKRGDMGIDGWKDDLPLQVKQSEKVGRNVVDNFATAIRRAKRAEGTIIAWNFGVGAKNEAARQKNEDNITIHLVEVGEIIPVNHRPRVEIKWMQKDDDQVIVTATAKDPDKDDIVLWSWYVEGKKVGTDIVAQRKRTTDSQSSSFSFKYREPVWVRVVATDGMGARGESRKKIGLDNAYRSPSVERLA